MVYSSRRPDRVPLQSVRNTNLRLNPERNWIDERWKNVAWSFSALQHISMSINETYAFKCHICKAGTAAGLHYVHLYYIEIRDLGEFYNQNTQVQNGNIHSVTEVQTLY